MRQKKKKMTQITNIYPFAYIWLGTTRIDKWQEMYYCTLPYDRLIRLPNYYTNTQSAIGAELEK